MRLKTIEKWVLLEQTGELSARRKRLLDAQPESEAIRHQLKVLGSGISRCDIEPSPWAVTKITARLHEERHSVVTFSKLWKPVFLTVACLTLLVSTFNFNQTFPAPAVVATAEVDVWNVQFEEDLVELENLILAMSGDPLDIMEM